jgi:DNA-binding NarL/FixJ family response regulator
VATKPSLLIADDDPMIRSLLLEALRDDFDLVAAADNAHDAAQLALQHRPDGALIDVVMPGGGLEAVREISAQVPGVAIVVLSGDESPNQVTEILEAGAMAYVRKGATGPEITARLNAAVAAKSRR